MLPSGVRKPLELAPSLSRQSLRSRSASKKERSSETWLCCRTDSRCTAASRSCRPGAARESSLAPSALLAGTALGCPGLQSHTAPQAVLGPSQALLSLPQAGSCSGVTSSSPASQLLCRGSRCPTRPHFPSTPALTGRPPSQSSWCGGCWPPQSVQPTTAWSLEHGGETQSKTWLWLPGSRPSPSRRRAGSSCGQEAGGGEPDPRPMAQHEPPMTALTCSPRSSCLSSSSSSP